MGNCDMCGKESETLINALVEGTELSVCSSCANYGKIMKRPRNKNSKIRDRKENKDTEPKSQIIMLVKEDYPKTIRDKRESLGLKQKELAVKLAERESLIQKIETGHIKPSLKLARKFEQALDIILIEQTTIDSDLKLEKQPSGDLTIGDMIKFKET